MQPGVTDIAWAFNSHPTMSGTTAQPPLRRLLRGLMLYLIVGLLSIISLPAVNALHSTDTITSGGDNTRSGYQTNHNMDPAVVGSSQFGIIWRKKLLGRYNGFAEQIFAQALVYTPDPTIIGPTGEPRQFVYIASQMNMIYKIDAITGDILLSRNLHIPFLVADLDGCNDISNCIGSTATGVIDPETHTWYLTTKTYVDQTGVEKGKINGRYYVHAIDTRTLEEKPNFPVNLEGLIATNNPIRMFQGGIHHQRPALMQYGEWVYAGFASHCVQYNFTGWVVGWHRESGEIVEAFATEGGPENKKGGGVWMSGGGLASDVPGRMLFATGNGYASQLDTIPVPGRQPPTALEEAVVHMKIGDDGKLRPVDFFMPWEKTALDGADKDLGTSGIALLDPKVFTSPLVKRIGCITGKSGKLYFLNLDDLGGYQMGPNKKDAVLQVVELKNSVFATAGSYPGTPDEGAYVYVNVVQHETVVFKFSVGPNGEPIFTQVAESPEKTAYILGVGHGTTTSMNRQPGSGLYWVTDIQGLNLRVYNAVPQNGKLQLIKGLNIPGQIKFSRPSFGNGRAYMTTSTGELVMVGSPVNPPLLCDSPVQFGEVTMGDAAGIEMQVSCKANIATTITDIALRIKADFKISGLPALPLTLAKGQTVTFKATFFPTGPGPLSDDVQIATTNGVANYAETTPVALRGIGRSLNPILDLSPNTVSFPGTITGAESDGIFRSFVIYNRGDSELQFSGYDLSSVSEAGPFLPEGSLVAGPFTFGPLPQSIPPRGSVTINVNFNPTVNGNYGAYLLLKSNGGKKFVTIVGTSGGYPVAKLEFEKPDGTGWAVFNKSDPDFVFDFGNVYEQQTRNLNLRLTNAGDPDAAILGVTVSKPPIAAGQIVGARNGVDLGEGTQLLPGESANATLICSVPKSQINVNSYIANATWTMNLGDPDFGKHELKFVCHAIAEQGGPVYTDGQARYRYLGCFKENNPGRQLEQQLYGTNTLTNGQCIQDCFSHTKNFKYAGTQYHRECWCGNTLPALKVGDEDCNFDCTGNGTQICGGNGYFGGGSYISLFGDSERVNGTVPTGTPTIPVVLPPSSTTAPPTPTINPGNDIFGYAGCYAEPTSGGRALSTLWGTDDLTVNACLARCPTANYIAVEYGRECWCGTTIRAEATLKDDKECSMLCKGNAGEYCGAGGKFNLYTRKPTSSATSTTSTTAEVTVVPETSTSVVEVVTTSTTAAAVETSTTAPADSTTTPPPAEPTTSTPAPAEPTTTTTTSTAPPAGPTIVPGAAGYSHIGCYTEATSGRALGGKSLATDTLTVPMCIDFCSTNNFPYAGVEYGRECWCGSALGTGAVLADNQATCSMTCKGDKGTYCGASVRLNVYYKGDGGVVTTSSTIASASVTAAPTEIVPPVTTTPPPPPPTTSTTSSAIPTSTSAWTYLGCANQTSPNALSAGSLTLSNMTVPYCQNFCVTQNFPLAGVSNGNTCTCGTALSSSSTLNQSNCTTPCTGDPTQSCGGSAEFLNVYNYTLTLSPVIPPAVGDFLYQGCYTEVAGRTVSGYSFTNTTGMTVEMCVERCRDRGWKVAGLEYMQECYCSNAVRSATVKMENRECGMLCRGNKREFCGGSSRVGVYVKNGTVVF